MALRQNFSNSAFSLLEVVVSIAVLSIGISMVLQAFSFSIRTTKLSCDIIDATFLAKDKLQELEFKEKYNLINNEDNHISGTKDKYNWEYFINFEPELSLYPLSLYVTWKTRRGKESLSINTYLR